MKNRKITDFTLPREMCQPLHVKPAAHPLRSKSKRMKALRKKAFVERALELAAVRREEPKPHDVMLRRLAQLHEVLRNTKYGNVGLGTAHVLVKIEAKQMNDDEIAETIDSLDFLLDEFKMFDCARVRLRQSIENVRHRLE